MASCLRRKRFCAASGVLDRKLMDQKVQQIGLKVQPKPAGFHDQPMSLFPTFSFQIWLQFSAFQAVLVIFAQDNAKASRSSKEARLNTGIMWALRPRARMTPASSCTATSPRFSPLRGKIENTAHVRGVVSGVDIRWVARAGLKPQYGEQYLEQSRCGGLIVSGCGPRRSHELTPQVTQLRVS